MDETFSQSAIGKINVAEELMLTPINEFKNMVDTFRYAIENEIRAKNMYCSLSLSSNDESWRELFDYLATEEGKHEELLKNELKTLGI